jgi:hypothetical protein
MISQRLEAIKSAKVAQSGTSVLFFSVLFCSVMLCSVLLCYVMFSVPLVARMHTLTHSWLVCTHSLILGASCSVTVTSWAATSITYAGATPMLFFYCVEMSTGGRLLTVFAFV